MDCESPFENITTPGTTIVSPNYPTNYGYNLDCQVTITFKDKVSIVFDNFNVEYDSSCDYDWLNVHDGDSSGSKLISSKLCGDDIPSPMNSTGNSMTLVFHSDDHYNYKGFEIMTRHLVV